MGALPSGCVRGVPHRDGSEGTSPPPTGKVLEKPAKEIIDLNKISNPIAFFIKELYERCSVGKTLPAL